MDRLGQVECGLRVFVSQPRRSLWLRMLWRRVLPGMGGAGAFSRRVLAPLVVVAVFSGCSLFQKDSSEGNIPNADTSDEYDLLRLIDDIPVPGDTSVDTRQSLVLGNGSSWTGRLFMILSINSTRAYALYQKEMSNFGWRQILAVQETIGQLFYVNDIYAVELVIVPDGRGTQVRATKSLLQNTSSVPLN